MRNLIIMLFVMLSLAGYSQVEHRQNNEKYVYGNKAEGRIPTLDNRGRLVYKDPSGLGPDSVEAIILSTITGGYGIDFDPITGIITNTLPDQTVSLTAGAGISITGSYPSFTINSSGSGLSKWTDTGADIWRNSKVGIGYSTPGACLDVYGASQSAIYVRRAGVSSKVSKWDFTTGTMEFGTSTPDGFAFMTNGVRRLVMYSNSAQVEISSFTLSDGRIYMYSGSETPTLGVGSTAPFIIQNSTNTMLTMGGATGYTYIQNRRSTNASTVYPLSLNPIGGNVGIGTATMTSKLDVAGDVEITSSNSFIIGDPTTDGSWRMMISGANFVIQKRESGSWVTKSTITP